MSSIKKSNVQKKIKVDPKLTPQQTQLLGRKIVDLIRERTSEGLGSKDEPFQGYSKSYKNSLDFKIAGKTNTVNLRQTGDMMADLDVLSIEGNTITIGYEMDYEDIGKVHGNVTGEYGNDSPVTKPRNFIGISDSWLEILTEEVLFELPQEQSERDRVVNTIFSRFGL